MNQSAVTGSLGLVGCFAFKKGVFGFLHIASDIVLLCVVFVIAFLTK